MSVKENPNRKRYLLPTTGFIILKVTLTVLFIIILFYSYLSIDLFFLLVCLFICLLSIYYLFILITSVMKSHFFMSVCVHFVSLPLHLPVIMSFVYYKYIKYVYLFV